MKTIVCNNCNKEIEKYRLKNKNHFCNIKCKALWQKNGLCGKNNPFYDKKHTLETKHKISKIRKELFSENKITPPGWKGGISRPSKVYQNWRNQVLKRDNNECCCCLKKTNIVHHIIPFYKCRPNFDINNGLTLCSTCHNQIEAPRKGVIRL